MFEVKNNDPNVITQCVHGQNIALEPTKYVQLSCDNEKQNQT
jgi:hypothetical protein